MAQNQANFGLNFKVDKTGLNDLKKSLQDIRNFAQQQSKNGGMTDELKQACEVAKQLEGILNGAWNSKLGQLNLNKVTQGINTTYGSVTKLRQQLEASGNTGVAAFNKMASQVLSTNLQIKQSNKLLDNMATSMANTVKWGITSSIFNTMTRSIQDAFYYVKNLDSSLNDIRIVTGASADQMAAFAEQANIAAKALGQSTRNYTDASLIYYQQGLSTEEVKARTETTLKAANVTGQSAQTVSEQLTAVWNGYKVSAEEAELYVDKLAAVAASTASDLEELSTGMSKVASAANAMGVDVDQLNAQLSTIISVTRQAPESVGTALKTIYARMSDLKLGGVDEDGMGLGKVTSQMEAMGIQILGTNGDLRDMGSIIEEVASKWDTWNSAQQTAMAQVMAGTRQYNNLVALFDNWDMYTAALETSTNAMGTLQGQQDIYLESTKAHIQQLKTEIEETYSHLLDTKAINGFVDLFKGAVNQVNDFFGVLDSSTSIIIHLGATFANVFNQQIGKALTQQYRNIQSFIQNIQNVSAKKGWLKEIIFGDLKDFSGPSNQIISMLQMIKESASGGKGVISTSALKEEAIIAQQILQSRKSITQEEYNHLTAIQQKVGINAQEIEYLNRQQEYFNQNFRSEDELNQKLEKQLALREQLEQNKARMSNTAAEGRVLDNEAAQLEHIYAVRAQIKALMDSELITEANKQKLQEIQKALMNEELSTATIISLIKENYGTILRIQNDTLKSNASEEEKILQLIQAIKNIDAGRIQDLEKQNTSLKAQVSEYLKMANSGNKVANSIRVASAAVQGLNSLVKGVAKAMDETASASERVEGKWTAGTGVITSALSAIHPSLGMIGTTLASITKTVLEATGLWDEWIDKNKTLEEKITDINTATQEVNKISSESKTKISSLVAIQDEYEKLSDLAGKYGENLSSMTQEEQDRYHELTESFTQYNEGVILGYDAQGEAIVNNQKALKETIELLKEQAEIEARKALGNASKAIENKDEEIANKKEAYDLANSELAAVENLDQRVIDLNQDTLQVINTNIGDALMNITLTAEEYQNFSDRLSESFNNIQNASNISEIEASAEALMSIIDEANNTISKYEGYENFNLYDSLNYSEQDLKNIASITDNAMGAVAEAESALTAIQKFDTNFIMQILQFGQGYDTQWDSLSDQGQEIGYSLLMKYLEGITYGVEEGQASSYKQIIGLGQDFILGLGEAIDIGFTNIESKATDFYQNEENIGLSVKEKTEKIKDIIEEEIANIENYSDLSESVKKNLELMFENAFNIELELSADGAVDSIKDSSEEVLEKAYNKVLEVLENHPLIDEERVKEIKIDENTFQAFDFDMFKSLIPDDQVQNLDEIFNNIDWSKVALGNISLDTAIKEAVEAAKSSTSAISELREETKKGQEILDKLQNKKEISQDEVAFLKSLENEYDILQGLTIGTEEYNKALEEVLETKKQSNKTKLDEEKGKVEGSIRANKSVTEKFQKQQKRYEETDPEYKQIQTYIDTNNEELIELENYLDNLEYEILCLAIVEAEPSIKDQIQNLYNESDTLLTIRATLENDEALSDEQTAAIQEFFNSEEGQNFIGPFMNAGEITEPILQAMEAYAQGKTELAESMTLGLRSDTEVLIEEADRLMHVAELLREAGHDELADKLTSQAQEKYNQSTDNIGDIAQLDSEKDEYDSKQKEARQTSFENKTKSFDIDADEVDDIADRLQTLAETSDEVSDSLAKNEDAARDVAIELKRYDKALESVTKNSKKWDKALKSDNIVEQAEAVGEMDEAYSDLLNLDYGTLSDEFLSNAENLDLMAEAAKGGEDAYNELASRAQDDILMTCGFNVNDQEAMAKIDALEGRVLEGIDDIEVGAYIDDADAIQAMNQLINSAAMTADQATSYLASMGVDAEVVEEKVPESQKQSFIDAVPTIQDTPVNVPSIVAGVVEDNTVNVPTITYSGETKTETAEGEKTATALRVTSAKKSSGGGFKHSTAGGSKGGSGGGKGGGGGGGGGGKAASKVKSRKKNYYHNVDNTLKKLSNIYDKVAEAQDKAFGKKHIDNLTKINKNLDSQIEKMREKIKIANEQEKVDLKQDITSQFSDVKFNKDGTIANYEEVLAKYYAAYSNTGQSKESQDAAKEKYDTLKELLDEYETLILETIPGWEAEIREKINEKYENMTAQFEYEITMRTDWGESIREYKEFKHEFGDFTEDLIAQSTLAYNTSKSFFDSKELTSKTRQLNDALGELEKINSALKKGKDISKKGDEEYFSDVWGDNKQGLMDYIATLQTDLMDNLLAISDARNEAYDNYLEAIDEGISKMNEHLDQYNQLTEELDHNRNLIELIYGEESDKIGDIYKAQHKVNVESLKGHQIALANYQKQADIRRKQLEEEAKNSHTRSVTGAVQTTDRYKEIEEELKYYEEAIEETEATIRDTTTSSIENIIALYEYNVSQMFKNLNTKNLGFGLSEAQTQWDLLNKEAEQYLDTMNTTFEVQKLESKFVEAINKTDNLKSQERIKTVMDEQLRILEEKDKVSQYDVDRANLIYDLTLKQIALEEAQQNKSKMRLRRDAQGNYSYQFSADADLIKQTQQELLDVQQQLYNLDKNEYKDQLDIMAGYYEEWQNKLQEVALIKDAEERERTAAMVNDYYTRLIENAANQSQVAEENLENLLNGPLADFKAGNEEIADEIKTMYDSAFATMADNFAQEGGVADTIKQAWAEISDAAKDYLKQLKEISKVSKDSFGSLEDPSKIVEGVEQITAATKDLNKAWNATLKSLKSLFTKIDKFLDSPEIKAAIEALTKSESKEKSEKKKAGDAAEKANKEAVAEKIQAEVVKKEPTKPATPPKKEEPKKKEVKVGGQINAKGAYIYTYINKGRNTQLFASDPNYTVLKMQDGWVQVRHHKARPGVVDGWFKQSDVTALKSGGYTGNWNSEEGRLAFLHQKELVLNQRDTRNILDAVNIIRGLSGLLQNSMINRIEGLTQSLNNISIPTVQPNVETQPQSIEQTVHITAEFPGATEAIQIETALNSLVNRASQYANRKE